MVAKPMYLFGGNSGSFRSAIPTMSLGWGSAGHSMQAKLEAAAEAGFEGVEVHIACLESYAETLPGATQRDQLREAAKRTKAMADDLSLAVICLQPILSYEGALDAHAHREKLDEVVFRFELCRLLGTDLMQLAASFGENITGDEDTIVQDLQEIADLAALESPPIRFAYEAMCWSTFNNTWQSSWEVVQRVDRPNFGVLLDSFHIAGYEWADPSSATGKRPDADARLRASLAELPKAIPPERIFYVQVCDAAKPRVPIRTSDGASDADLPVRMRWSRKCRVLPYEEGAFMPNEETTKAMLATGFKGWISLELFNEAMSDPDPEIPHRHAQHGMQSFEKLRKRLRLY